MNELLKSLETTRKTAKTAIRLHLTKLSTLLQSIEDGSPSVQKQREWGFNPENPEVIAEFHKELQNVAQNYQMAGESLQALSGLFGESGQVLVQALSAINQLAPIVEPSPEEEEIPSE